MIERTANDDVLNVSDSVWYKNTYTLNSDFASKAKDNYYADQYPISMTDKDVAQINQWVSDKTDKMKSYVSEGDRKKYAIQVHSLKSTSRTIGAVELSDWALKLEKAADDGEWDTVVRENPGLLSDYEMTVRAVSAALKI